MDPLDEQSDLSKLQKKREMQKIDWSMTMPRQHFVGPPDEPPKDPDKMYGGRTRSQLIRQSRKKARMLKPKSIRKDERQRRTGKR